MFRYIKYIKLALLFFILLTSVAVAGGGPAPGRGAAPGGPGIPPVLDLECVNRRLIDPATMCPVDIPPRDALISAEDNLTCQEETGVPCDPDTSRCYVVDFNDPALIDVYTCLNIFDTAGANCGGPCAAAGEKCTVLNPVEMVRNPGVTTPQWRCINPNLSFNFLGVNVGSINILLPKLIRLGFTGFFGLIGVVLFFQLFTAIWEFTNTPDQTNIEETQKKIVNTLIGIFFIVVGIVIVQILASAFGVTGNIFDFEYRPI